MFDIKHHAITAARERTNMRVNSLTVNHTMYLRNARGRWEIGKPEKSGKAGGKRRDSEVIGHDADLFGLENQAENQFFDRELYYSSKKGKRNVGKKENQEK